MVSENQSRYVIRKKEIIRERERERERGIERARESDRAVFPLEGMEHRREISRTINYKLSLACIHVYADDRATLVII